MSDEDGQLVYTNPRLQAIYGYDAHELSGLGFTRVFYPEDYATALANWLRVSRTNESHNLERRFIHANGEKRWARVRSSLMISSDGAVLGRVGTVEDITDHRQALLELQSSEARYRMLAEHSTDMISKHAADGTMLYVFAGLPNPLGIRARGTARQEGRRVSPSRRSRINDRVIPYQPDPDLDTLLGRNQKKWFAFWK